MYCSISGRLVVGVWAPIPLEKVQDFLLLPPPTHLVAVSMDHLHNLHSRHSVCEIYAKRVPTSLIATRNPNEHHSTRLPCVLRFRAAGIYVFRDSYSFAQICVLHRVCAHDSRRAPRLQKLRRSGHPCAARKSH